MTKENENTPGPWAYINLDKEVKIYKPGSNGEACIYNRIANLPRQRQKREKTIVCGEEMTLTRVTRHGIENEDEIQANARLIAAAPELLEALEGLIGAWSADAGNIRDDGPHWRIAGKAIKKARGEE